MAFLPLGVVFGKRKNLGQEFKGALIYIRGLNRKGAYCSPVGEYGHAVVDKSGVSVGVQTEGAKVDGVKTLA